MNMLASEKRRKKRFQLNWYMDSEYRRSDKQKISIVKEQPCKNEEFQFQSKA